MRNYWCIDLHAACIPADGKDFKQLRKSSVVGTVLRSQVSCQGDRTVHPPLLICLTCHRIDHYLDIELEVDFSR